MRLLAAIALAGCLSLVNARDSAAQGQVTLDGFGSVSLNQITSFGGSSSFPLDFGGRVAVDLFPGLQAVGEFGRLQSLLPSTVSIPIDFLPFDVGVSAFYGEGGLRLMTEPTARVRPYIEGSVGVAHINFDVRGFGSTVDAIANSALDNFGRRYPMAGFGGGVLLGAGSLQFDLGYRYKQVFASELAETLLAGGDKLRTNQIRFGMGVRF